MPISFLSRREKEEEIQEAKVSHAAAKETCLCCNSGGFRGTRWHFYIKRTKRASLVVPIIIVDNMFLRKPIGFDKNSVKHGDI